jgi:ERCC4-type nuclease
MEAFEQAAMLDSMKIYCDTREQPTERSKKRYESFGVPYERRKLEYGDYTYTAQKPDGKWIYEGEEKVYPHISIERKMNLDELALCFTAERDRFEREFERAKEHKAKTILLVEDATWENLLNGRYRSKFAAKAFAASISTYISRYGITLVFCKAETSGRIIHDLLYYDLRERILEGEYDS